MKVSLDVEDAQKDADSRRVDHREPLEITLVRWLWKWSCTAKQDDAPLSAPVLAEISAVLDGFLTGVLRTSGSDGVRSCWCDGVLCLHVSQPTPTSFCLIGATIWAGAGPKFYVAPFECDFDFSAPDDREASRIVVRFGKRDRRGDIVRLGYDAAPDSVIASRPKSLSEWAFAVEVA